METKETRMGITEMTLAMAMAGSIGVFVLESGQSAFNVAFYRCLFGTLALVLYCGYRRQFRRDYLALKPLALIMLGGVCLVYNWALLFAAYKFTSIAIATIVYHINPFIIMLLGVVLFRDAIEKHQIIWTLLAFIGLLFVIGIPTELSGNYMLGIIFTLLATTLYSFTVVLAKWLQAIAPEFIALVQVAVGILLLYPLTSLAEVPATGNHWFYLIGLGVLHTCVQYALLYSAFQRLPMALIAILSFIYPVVAVILDYLIYDHVLALVQWLGIGAITVATLGVKLHWRWSFECRN